MCDVQCIIVRVEKHWSGCYYCHFSSDVTDSHTNWMVISVSLFLICSVSLLQSHLLWVRSAGVSVVTIRTVRRGLTEGRRGLGFHYFVEVCEVRHVFAGGRERHDGLVLVTPEDLIGQVRGSHLTGG